ncbi:hypothetical protein [Halorientalis halophila]|uniref:hypothetical protein n=1 Tax=Halorientalis halophila TaxID=3108499 RepID=UPI0030099925
MAIQSLLEKIRTQEAELSDEEKLWMICSEIFPPLTDDKNGSRYRLSVANRFIQLEGSPVKRDDDGDVYRTENESRLDRALTQTADAYDRSEATIRSLCIHDVYNGESQTEQFLEDLLKVEEKYKML